MIDDIRQASDDQMSFTEAIGSIVAWCSSRGFQSMTFQQMLQTDYTLGPQICLEPYHVAVVRTSLTRNIATRFAEIMDEITAAFGDYVPIADVKGIPLAFPS